HGDLDTRAPRLGRGTPKTRPVASLETTFNGLVQLAERLDDEVEDGRPNFANLAKLPIGQPLPCFSGAPDGPVPSARECLLNSLDGGNPVGVPQPFPTGTQNVDCPIPCTRQRLLNPLDDSGPVGVPHPFPTGAENVDCPIPGRRQPITEGTDPLRDGRSVLVEPIPSIPEPVPRPAP